MDKVVIISYFDDKYDYFKLKIPGGEFLISGTGLGIQRCDTILTQANVKNAVLERYDDAVQLKIDRIESVCIGKDAQYSSDGVKVHTICSHAAQILEMLGFGRFCDCLGNPAEAARAEKLLSHIIGAEVKVPENPTVGETVGAALKALEIDSGNIFEAAEKSGVLMSTKKETYWFKEKAAPMAAIGLYRETTVENAPLCYDELAGIAYNLLLMEFEHKRFLVRLAEKDAGFAEKITSTYERTLVYPYYEYFGIRVKQKIFKDIDGKDMPCCYVPGANLNHTYLNEYTTVDGVHYVFCALFDRHIRKWGRGIPVLYNARTKKTIQLHDRINMRCYAMLMSKDKKIYFTADEFIYCYDMENGRKSMVYKEPRSRHLQEIPTITDDGRYLLFFYGTEQAFRPNRACRLDIKTGVCETVLDTDWVEEHFGNEINPFAGHFIINPVRKNLINFLHGGPANVKDRMWLVDTDTQRIWEPYRQQTLEDGSLAEALTHWVWSANGERLYFVRIRRDTQLKSLKNGICYIEVNKDNGIVRVIETEHECIHSSPDYEDKYFISDTYNNAPDQFSSDIFLYNADSRREKVLHRVHIKKNHPGHPHPQFSAKADEIIFACSPEDSGAVCVCVENIGNVKKMME